MATSTKCYKVAPTGVEAAPDEGRGHPEKQNGRALVKKERKWNRKSSQIGIDKPKTTIHTWHKGELELYTSTTIRAQNNYHLRTKKTVLRDLRGEK